VYSVALALHESCSAASFATRNNRPPDPDPWSSFDYQINKPYLPMVNGAFSSDTALSVIAMCTTCSLVLGKEARVSFTLRSL
jgi:hypothetical protein